MDGMAKVYVIFWLAFIEKAFATEIKQKFTFINSPMTWNEALHTCRDLGMSLIQVENQLKQTYIEKFAPQWQTYVTGPVWIGLHETSEYPAQQHAWGNCSLLGSFNNFQTANPSFGDDDAFCFAVDIQATHKWIVKRCSENYQFICEQDVGPCTFSLTANKGCFYNNFESSEVQLNQCLEECRTSNVRTDGTECWGVGHFPGFSGDDCRKVFSTDPEVCIQYMGNLNSGTLGIKECFESGISTAVSPVSNSLLLPDTQCFVYATTDPPVTTQPTSASPSILSTTETEFTTMTESDTTTESQVTSTLNSSCICLCQNISSLYGIDEAEFQRLLSSMVVNKKDTSNYRRRLISAEDNRTSAIAVGYVGVTILVIIFGSIIALDFPLLALNFKILYSKIRKTT